ncbi:endolytic transglycosylase MltG [Desmospora profundinema]|uniref:Endolytic murein transglycosylase n=1 Tax=Desmospora profundinema TaxID=1571184 RepID=A0ABU1IKG8_9BACL|nr:endolytic transglycosylase MltG [Desmospora profundinema]MDR6225186.1 UPF0755 protein [Desmospora profundinema]
MKWIWSILLTLVITAALAVSGYWYVQQSLQLSSGGESVEVEVPQGASVLDVGQILERENVIEHGWLFALYAWLEGKSKGLKAGVYEIPPHSTAQDILGIFADGSQNVMSVTIPEGFTVDQVADRVAKRGVEREAFLKAVNEAEYAYDFVQQIPADPKRTHRLEGYLYPITYNLPRDADPHELVDKMLRQFQRELEHDDIKQKLDQKGLTVDEWVTIASIIEREGQVKEELPRIAGVIYNRLDDGMKLQVDATVQYALGKQKERLFYKDLEIDSPYNTYRIEGLPPGPIANPGKAALRAALEPEEHDYFFYVTRKDGTGKHYFARTEKEHEQNIEKSKQRP